MTTPPTGPYASGAPLDYRGPAPAPVGAAPVTHGAGPLTPEHLAQLDVARTLWKKVRRTLAVAAFDYWGLGIFSVLTLLGSVVAFSVSGLAIGLAMGACAWNEYNAAQKLRRLELDAPWRLGMNQLFLGGALLLYAAWALYSGLHDPSSISGMVSSQVPDDPMISQTMGSINDLTRIILFALYGTLALVAIFVQGSTALYYFSRVTPLRKYLEETPEWIRTAQQQGISLL